MTCECTKASVHTQQERATLRIALALNATMFVVGTVAGFLAQSTGLMADALDMLTDSFVYVLALLAISRSARFKRNAARLGGSLLLILGAGIVFEVLRRALFGSEPQGEIMMVFSAASLVVNMAVLRMLGRFRHGEIHLRSTWLFTRVDVLANMGVFISGVAVWITGIGFIDLIIGLVIGLYVVKEALGILREVSQKLE